MAGRAASLAPSMREASIAPSELGAAAPGAAVVAVPVAMRRLVLRIFTKKYGLALHSSAVTFIYTTLQSHELTDSSEECAEAIEWLAKGLIEAAEGGDQGSSIVTRAALEKVYQQLLLEDSASQRVGAQLDPLVNGETVDPARYFHPIDVFKMPRIVFDERRKVFEKSSQLPKILAPPQAKPGYMLERLRIVQSIVLRNENFLPPLATGIGRDRDAFMRLTSTANLLGRQGQRFLLFGMLCSSADGRFALEDGDGRVGLDLDDAAPGEGLFTEGSMVLVEGEYTAEERIHVFALGQPPSESRETGKLICGAVDFNGTGAVTSHEAKALRVHEQRHPNLSFVFISDLHLDDPKTLRKFEAILRGYMESDFIPYAFVLCGAFVSHQRTSDVAPASASKSVTEQYQDAFAAFGDLLVRFPHIVKGSHFIFVPAAEDPNTTQSLPRKPLPKSITDRLVQRIIRGNGGNVSAASRFHFVSNPCRLVYFGQEIVVFRDNLLQRMLAHTVRLKGDANDPTRNLASTDASEEEEEIDIKRYLVSTILDQAHLCPLPAWARPVLWEFDHTLRLYPMPSALILADSTERYELKYEGCNVFNPSSFREGNFAWTTYYPASGKAECSELIE